MNKADCFNLGYVAKLHGYKGEVSLFFDVSSPEVYGSLDAVYIDLNGILTPFFIESLKMRDKGFALVKFEGVTSEIDAKAILRKDLYLPLEVLPKLSGTNFYDHEVIGFSVIDENFGEVGEVVQIIDFKINPLIQIESREGKEVLLPLIEGLVKYVDRKNKALTVHAPEGLIELYLS
ncbi:MAG: ribosome maturation factor RimM [Brumimicrobium sp.]|nr:ribosome maturation factor RimM [Brumimicrobium sp.]